jgi:hypothetical protein
MSVSSPFRTPSLQRGGRHAPAKQIPLAHSVFVVQVMPGHEPQSFCAEQQSRPAP